MGNTTYRWTEDKSETARWSTAVGAFVLAFGSIEATTVDIVDRVNPQRHWPASRMKLGPRLDRAIDGLELCSTWRRDRVRQALEVAKRMVDDRNLIAHSPVYFRFQLTERGASMGLVLACSRGSDRLITLAEIELLAKRADRLASVLDDRWELVVAQELND